jgi:hypothetical protein
MQVVKLSPAVFAYNLTFRQDMTTHSFFYGSFGSAWLEVESYV